MRIDAHHHLWRYDPVAFGWIEPGCAIARDFAPADLTAAIRAGGIDACIAVQARQLPEETDFLLRCAETTPEIVGVVGWIDLRSPDVAATIDEQAHPALLGYRHVVQDEPDPRFLRQEAFVRGVAAVAARGLTYDLLVTHEQLADVPALLDRIGDGRFVFDHAAKPAIASGGWQPWADRVSAVAAYPHIWCKISGLVTEADHRHWSAAQIERYLDHVLTLFGPHRLIWGSDWPVCLLAAGYGDVVRLIEDFVASRCPGARDAVFGGNAIAAYAIQR
ncbi:amidohydrolase family protein [Sphingomonas sp. Tas61C01]|uniref:amidohydrolase family protein n=1 Tax=Sphingomonas sp. Tas61C01 TaxID=3458297 RepID=UPI00403EACB3